MTYHIPTDLIIELLVRLPVKTLLRFTLVCKLWYSIITNSDFVNIHLNRFSERNSGKLFLKFYSITINYKDHYILIPDMEKLNENQTELAFSSNISSSTGCSYVIGGCSGMICLRNGPKHVIIWNPSLRKSVTVTLSDKPHEKLSVLGFGYVSEKSEYKLVRISFYSNHNEYNIVPLEVEVYEQREEHWRAIKCVPPLHCEVSEYSQVFLHGAVHWLAFNTTVMFHNLVVVFDMCDEGFRDIALPSILAKQYPLNLSITLLGKSLAVLETEELGTKLSLWEMRDHGVLESWTKLLCILLPENFNTPLRFGKDGKGLFLTKSNELVLYDSKAKAITSKTTFRGGSCLNIVHNYVESLVLLKCEKG